MATERRRTDGITCGVPNIAWGVDRTHSYADVSISIFSGERGKDWQGGQEGRKQSKVFSGQADAEMRCQEKESENGTAVAVGSLVR